MHDVIKYGDKEIMFDRVSSRNKESSHRCIQHTLKPATSERLVFECQFAIHTRTTWTQFAC